MSLSSKDEERHTSKRAVGSGPSLLLDSKAAHPVLHLIWSVVTQRGSLSGPPWIRPLRRCDNEYSMMYRLTLDGSPTPKLAESHYGAADAAGAAGCRTMAMPKGP
jgi:hypothetical protein